MKKHKQKHNQRSFEDEEGYDFRNEAREHRREKRMKNALKTKNIQQLIELDEDYD